MITSDLSKIYERVENCRTCHSGELTEILNLGLHPLANSLLDTPEDFEVKAPLILIRCKNCTTIQLSINVKPELMFQEYLWVTGTTETAKNHCTELAQRILKTFNIENPRILEIGSNDGTLLKSLANHGCKEVIGVDPAGNLQPKQLKGSVKLVEGFFNHELGRNLGKSINKVDIVVARNVLSHVPNLNDVMLGIDEIINDSGMIVIEFHDASKILTELHYESIYHEHTFYHSIKSIQAALSQIGFKIFDLSKSPISGGSHVVYASRDERSSSYDLSHALYTEEALGVYDELAWFNFATKANDNLRQLRELFISEKNSRWIAFGASARSSTLLNSIGESSKCLNKIADNNLLKQGKFSPGIHLEICNPSELVVQNLEKIFICAFNFEDEIINFLRHKLNWSGEIVLPLPNNIRRYKI